jgi:hypothetical protein
MSRNILPITQDKLDEWHSYLELVTFNDIKRKDGKYYIRFRYDPQNEQYVVKWFESMRIAVKHRINPLSKAYTVRGRLLELITLRIIYDILSPYAKYFPKVKIQGGRTSDMVRACFLNAKHRLYDIYIPFLDLYIDCKHKGIQNKDYPYKIKNSNKRTLKFILNEADNNIIRELAEKFPRFRLAYFGGYVSTPIIRGSEFDDKLYPTTIAKSIFPTGSVQFNSASLLHEVLGKEKISQNGRKMTNIYDLDINVIEFIDRLKGAVEERLVKKKTDKKDE